MVPWMGRSIRVLAQRFREFMSNAGEEQVEAQALAPALVANLVLMHLETWGEHGTMSWSDLVARLQAHGVPEPALDAALGQYTEITVDRLADRVRLSDPGQLRARLRVDLATR